MDLNLREAAKCSQRIFPVKGGGAVTPPNPLRNITMITRMTKRTRMMTLMWSSQGDPVVESGQITSLSVHRKGFHWKDLISAK